MKKLILTLTATAACLGAFAQGKISFQTDSLHLAFFNPSTANFGGQAVYAGNGPAGVNFMADLYMGTTAGSLSLITSSAFGATPGKWGTISVLAPAPYNAGTSVFVEVQVRDGASAAPTTFTGTPFGTYYGASQEFNFTMGSASSPVYPVMWGASGNWAAGSQALDAYGAGSKGAIMVTPVPEPATFALAGLGAAAMLIFRRRK
jgi:hypothetical protein